MNIKIQLKRLLGERTTHYLKCILQYCKFFRGVLSGNYGKIECAFDHDIYSIPGKHVFFGYYDIQQVSKSSDKLLLHVLDKDAVAGETPVEIFCVDRKSGEFDKITESAAWSWQQGARLRWSNKTPNAIYFNNYHESQYYCEMWDVDTKRMIKRFQFPFYDIAPNEEFGLSLNFSRLQRLRPGYGYSNEPDKTTDQNYPGTEGITYVNLNTTESRVLLTLEELSEKVCADASYQGYINHISISPESDKFMFFFLWTEKSYLPWKNCLCIYDLKENALVILEREIIASHYCWISNSELIITSIEGEYYIFDVDNRTKRKLTNTNMVCDGHPSYYSDKEIITDTYPQKDGCQRIRIEGIEDDSKKELVKVFSDPRMFGDKRCDTHPRYERKNGLLTFDAMPRNKERIVISGKLEVITDGSQTKRSNR